MNVEGRIRSDTRSGPRLRIDVRLDIRLMEEQVAEFHSTAKGRP